MIGTPDLTPPPRLTELEARLQSHPDRLRAGAEIAAAAARARESRAARVPDLDVRFGIRRLSEFERSGFVGGVALPLPLWNSRRGAVAASEAERAAADARRFEVERRLEVELRTRHERVHAADEIFTTLRDRVVPSTEEALAYVRSGYRSGRLSYLELLESQRATREAHLTSLEAARDAWSARLALDRLVASTPAPAGEKEER